MYWIELVHHIRPEVTLGEFGLILLGVHSPLLTQSQLLSFPPATKMLQFTGLQPISGQRAISGSMVACTYPELIAACHGPKPEPGHPLYGLNNRYSPNALQPHFHPPIREDVSTQRRKLTVSLFRQLCVKHTICNRRLQLPKKRSFWCRFLGIPKKRLAKRALYRTEL